MIGESFDPIEQNLILGSIGSNAGIDWRQRCVDSELALHQLISHSNKIRQIFVDKIANLENRLKDALKRAEDSELRYYSIMESLIEKKSRKQNEENQELPELNQLKHAMEEKERVINELELKIEEQKKLRLRDAKQVEEKAAKIKEWVAIKLKELEEQNQCLRDENRKCNEELKDLRKYLHKASPETKRKIEFVLDRYCDQSSLFANNRLYSYKNGIAFTIAINPNIVSSLASTFTMRDDLHEMMAKRSQLYGESDSMSFSNSSDEEALAPKQLHLSRSVRQQKPIPPPRTRLPIGVRHESPTDASPLIGYANRPINPYFSRAGSLDRKLADMKKLNFSELRRKKTGIAANEFHDYSEIYTPSRETNPLVRETEINARPPTPPLHRCPSWESRIYRIASTGIPSLNSTPNHSMRLTPKERNSSKRLPQTVLSEYNVPVFATVKGRASRIRSMPFTDDSTDSSDNEVETRITTTTIGTTGTTSSSGQENDGFEALRRSFRREISIDSELSEDYALPPDAVMSPSLEESADESSEELQTPKRFSSLHKSSETYGTYDQINLQKSGYLSKLGGRLKTWRRRWFVFKDGVLCYYRSQSDANKGKPRAKIPLDISCRVLATGDSSTFQLATEKKVYYLTADSIATLEEWIKVFNSALKHNSSYSLQESQKPAIEGLLTKVKLGHSRNCWCAIYGRHLVYFKTANDKTPINRIDLKGSKVEEVNNFSDSDNEDNGRTNTSLADKGYGREHCEHTLSVVPKHSSDPIYLLMSSKQELSEWLYHLTLASTGEHLAGTSFEHLVSRLMKAESDCADTLDGHSLWKSPILLYTKDNISEPLTTLPNEHLKSEAIKLFKSIQLFISAPLDSSGIDYHVTLLQNCLQLCFSHPELQNELFCQLVKQTSPHSACNKLCGSSGVQQFLLCATHTIFACDSSGTCSEKTSPTSVAESGPTIKLQSYDKSIASNFIFIQSFQILSLALSLFSPQSRTLWLLRHHLRRSSDTRTEFGKYAIYCQRALDRALKNGPRELAPSRMEVLSILLRNPYHHSHPHSIPVNFVNKTYHVIGFDGSTTVEEFCQSINNEVSIRDNTHSGFALFSDDPIDKEAEHLLESTTKVADVISRWERTLRENRLGRFENTKVVKLIYKRRLCFKNSIKGETEKEKLLSVYEINDRVVCGVFPVTQELALELSALMAQIEFGDFVLIARPQMILSQAIDRFFPIHYKQINLLKTLVESVRDKWMELKGRSTHDCVRIYLNCARKWPFWDLRLFEATLSRASKTIQCLTRLWIGVSEDSIVLLELDSFNMIHRYSYKNVITFGGCKQDFMLVLSAKSVSNETDSGSGTTGSSRTESMGSERLLFSMTKARIVEITLLIADYINSDSSLNAISTLDSAHSTHPTLDSSQSTAVSNSLPTALFSRVASLKYSQTHTKL